MITREQAQAMGHEAGTVAATVCLNAMPLDEHVALADFKRAMIQGFDDEISVTRAERTQIEGAQHGR